MFTKAIKVAGTETYRYIHPETHLPYIPHDNREITDLKLLTVENWRKRYAVFVNILGQIVHLDAKRLDAALSAGKVFLDSDWRELFKNEIVLYTQSNELYVDKMTGLPPVDAQGNLLDCATLDARAKIISGEYITIKRFIADVGHFVFLDLNNRISELTGSALQAALDQRLVEGSTTKRCGKSIKAHKDKFVHFTPPIARKPEIPSRSSLPQLNDEPRFGTLSDSTSSQVSVKSTDSTLSVEEVEGLLLSAKDPTELLDLINAWVENDLKSNEISTPGISH